jgi:hypothetical protein
VRLTNPAPQHRHGRRVLGQHARMQRKVSLVSRSLDVTGEQ